jgi:hypothetical protein
MYKSQSAVFSFKGYNSSDIAMANAWKKGLSSVEGVNTGQLPAKVEESS